MPRGLRLGMRFSPEQGTAAPAPGVPTPAYVTGARPNILNTVSLSWTSAAGFLPSAGQYIVAMAHGGSSGNQAFTLTGSNLSAISSRYGSMASSYRVSAWLVTASAASTITINGPATSESLNQVYVYSTGGLTDVGALSAQAAASSANPVTATITSVPANNYVFALARGRNGTTSAIDWGGGFVTGDVIATRDQASSPPAAWSSGDFFSMAYKAQPSAGNFDATITLTDDGTRETSLLAIAFAAA